MIISYGHQYLLLFVSCNIHVLHIHKHATAEKTKHRVTYLPSSPHSIRACMIHSSYVKTVSGEFYAVRTVRNCGVWSSRQATTNDSRRASREPNSQRSFCLMSPAMTFLTCCGTIGVTLTAQSLVHFSLRRDPKKSYVRCKERRCCSSVANYTVYSCNPVTNERLFNLDPFDSRHQALVKYMCDRSRTISCLCIDENQQR